jgi:hypothetical protein
MTIKNTIKMAKLCVGKECDMTLECHWYGCKLMLLYIKNGYMYH